MCQIMAIRLVGAGPGEDPSSGAILDASIVRAFKYVSQFVSRSSGGFAVRVINASFGKFQRSRTVSLMVRQTSRKQENGVLVVGAAGNEDSMRPNYPAGYADAIAVSKP
jgi:hypothetical protein